MSTIYIGERQSGKTTMLIEMSEKTGATIVVATYPMAKYIQLLAAQMGKKIPVPAGPDRNDQERRNVFHRYVYDDGRYRSRG